MTTSELIPIRPDETSVDELEKVLKAGHRAVIREADEFRPLAAHVHALMKAAYKAGKRDAFHEVTDRVTKQVADLFKEA